MLPINQVKLYHRQRHHRKVYYRKAMLSCGKKLRAFPPGVAAFNFKELVWHIINTSVGGFSQQEEISELKEKKAKRKDKCLRTSWREGDPTRWPSRSHYQNGSKTWGEPDMLCFHCETSTAGNVWTLSASALVSIENIKVSRFILFGVLFSDAPLARVDCKKGNSNLVTISWNRSVNFNLICLQTHACPRIPQWPMLETQLSADKSPPSLPRSLSKGCFTKRALS